MQLHGEPLPDVVEALRRGGGRGVEVPVYRWMPPADIAPLDRLLDAVVAGEMDVVAFTSAPAAASLLARAAERGLLDDLLRGCAGRCWRSASGRSPRRRWRRWTCRPCSPTLPPRRHGPPAGDRDARAAPARLPVAGHWLELRGQAVLVDGELRPVRPAPGWPAAPLARRAGRVVARAELRAALPGAGRRRRAGEGDGAAWSGARLGRSSSGPCLASGYRLAAGDPAAATGRRSGRPLPARSAR